MSSRPPEPPRLLERYRLLGQLAEGRLGPIWLAHRLPPGIAGPGACVCVKQLDGAPAEMLDELLRVMRLQHRNVCVTFELDFGDDMPFLVMEYLRGGPLSELPGDPRLVAGIAAQVREGLRAAHAHGVVHGALTADKVFVTVEGRAVILGFGTSRFRTDAVAMASHDLAAVAALFGEPDVVPLPEAAIGAQVAIACVARIRRERKLGATGGWVTS